MFEVWETESRNLAGSFGTQEEALTVLRAAAKKHGRAYLDAFSLLAFEHGRHRTIAEGADLASLAFAHHAGPANGREPGKPRRPASPAQSSPRQSR